MLAPLVVALVGRHELVRMQVNLYAVEAVHAGHAQVAELKCRDAEGVPERAAGLPRIAAAVAVLERARCAAFEELPWRLAVAEQERARRRLERHGDEETHEAWADDDADLLYWLERADAAAAAPAEAADHAGGAVTHMRKCVICAPARSLFQSTDTC